MQALSSLVLAEHLWGIPEMHPARVVAAFIADDGEVGLWPVVARLWADEVTVTVPAIDDADDLMFVRWDRGADLAPGRFGIPVPPGGEPVDVAGHDIILVPGVLFGPGGARAGRGRGYYDRALAYRQAPQEPAAPEGPLLVGIGHVCQWDPELRARPQDVTVDVFVSPAGVRRFQRTSAPWN